MRFFAMTLLMLFVLVGCTSRPVAMKTDKRYFSPVRTTAQARTPATKQSTRIVSLVIAEKEISAKNVTIELLKKENQRLRERIAKLEKHLAITNS